jgi:hypothetical protein
MAAAASGGRGASFDRVACCAVLIPIVTGFCIALLRCHCVNNSLLVPPSAAERVATAAGQAASYDQCVRASAHFLSKS